MLLLPTRAPPVLIFSFLCVHTRLTSRSTHRDAHRRRTACLRGEPQPRSKDTLRPPSAKLLSAGLGWSATAFCCHHYHVRGRSAIWARQAPAGAGSGIRRGRLYCFRRQVNVDQTLTKRRPTCIYIDSSPAAECTAGGTVDVKCNSFTSFTSFTKPTEGPRAEQEKGRDDDDTKHKKPKRA